MDLVVSVVMLLVTLCKQVELVCRIAIVLLQTHYNQLVTTPICETCLKYSKRYSLCKSQGNFTIQSYSLLFLI